MRRVSYLVSIISLLMLPLIGHAASQTRADQPLPAIDAMSQQCNVLTEDPIDPDKLSADGVAFDSIDAKAAVKTCKEAVDLHPQDAKLRYQYARSLRADKQNNAAVTEYQRAVDLGYPLANLRLASAYFFGQLGLEKDFAKVYELLQNPKVQEHEWAQYMLGRLYRTGRGVAQNESVALEWFKKSADQGDPRSFVQLSVMVFNGEGTTPDKVAGLKYALEAQALGSESALDVIDQMKSQMTEQQIALASKEANASQSPSTSGTSPVTNLSALTGTSSNPELDQTMDISGELMNALNMLAGTGFIGLLIILLILIVVIGYFVPFRLWITAWASGAYVGLLTLVAMRLRRVPPHSIIKARISAVKAGLSIPLDELESHFLAGGNVVDVVNAIISADKANIELSFNRAAAIDLAGRNVLDAVQMSVLPKVIQTPRNAAVAQDGIQLIGVARVTVRTNLDRLVGGAGEETIIARVGEGMVSAIGSAQNHKDVLERPDSISKKILANGLDAGTAYEILSIDIADIDVGKNIGAALQIEQANADKQIAQAKAEERRAMAVALEQEMRAKVVEAESEVPRAMADAFRAGRIYGTPA